MAKEGEKPKFLGQHSNVVRWMVGIPVVVPLLAAGAQVGVNYYNDVDLATNFPEIDIENPTIFEVGAVASWLTLAGMALWLAFGRHTLDKVKKRHTIMEPQPPKPKTVETDVT